eukprot:g3533.t1
MVLSPSERKSKISLRTILQKKLSSLPLTKTTEAIREKLSNAIGEINALLSTTPVSTSSKKKRKKSENETMKTPTKKQKISNKKAIKKQIRFANMSIAQHAQRKQLTKALEVFEKAKQRGATDVHTYTSIINACVRCGQLSEAQRFFEEMKLVRLVPNVVTYTAIIKGYSNAGNVSDAGKLLREMLRLTPPVLPNVRTVNTYLRGCMRSGCVEEAQWILVQMLSVWDVTPDSSTYEHVIALMCQGLLLNDANNIVQKLRDSRLATARDDTASNTALYVALARAALSLGEWEKCEMALDQARSALSMANSFTRRAFRTGEGLTSGKQLKPKVGRGSARQQQHSARLFEKHKRGELTRDIDEISKFLNVVKSEVACQKSDFHAALHCQSVISKMKRTILFPMTTTTTTDDKNLTQSDMCFQLEKELKKSFGLSPLLKAREKNMKQKCDREESFFHTKKEEKIISFTGTKKVIKNSNVLFKDDEENEKTKYLDFEKIFSDEKRINTNPIKLEICSGAGEWATAQAASSQSDSDNPTNWITLELRRDRCYQTFLRGILRRLNNLCVIAGDASFILPNYFSGKSVNNIFINHPEPPERTSDGAMDSQGKHLLTSQFFRSMYRVVKPGGTITIVTDNLGYAKFLTDIIARVKKDGDYFDEIAYRENVEKLEKEKEENENTILGSTTDTTDILPPIFNRAAPGRKRTWEKNMPSAAEDKEKRNLDARMNADERKRLFFSKEPNRNRGDQRNVACTMNGIHICNGVPSAQVKGGHSIRASSYFDRLWKAGQKSDRYSIILHRRSTSSSNSEKESSNSEKNEIEVEEEKRKKCQTSTPQVKRKPKRAVRISPVRPDLRTTEVRKKHEREAEARRKKKLGIKQVYFES